MAEVNGPTLLSMCLFSSVSMTFLVYHTYKYDKCRCLIPSKKYWFRGLLTWMLFWSNICLVGWTAGWAYVKYQLGWVKFGPAGARSWPSPLFPHPYDLFNAPLTVLLSVCYSFQAALTIEEALYWAHMMHSVRHPRTAVPFLKSRFYYAWVISAIVLSVGQTAMPWIGYNGNLQDQLSKELLCGAISEFVVWMVSVLVVLRFPRFLKEVKASGAGPDVQTRLYFYHEANKLRALLRFFIITPILILGADGFTKAHLINLTPLPSDLLGTMSVAALSIVFMISIVLYLPVPTPSSRFSQVAVGQTHPEASAHPLVSLLREGGRWEGLDDDLVPEKGREVAPFAQAGARVWSTGTAENGYVHVQPPKTLENFTSPIEPSAEEQPKLPVAIQMSVEREVYVDEHNSVGEAQRLRGAGRAT